jgi:phenylacetate-coenzyme A ligase PaaK-like adenylate-forming protein
VDGKIVNSIKENIGISVRVNLVEPNANGRNKGKTQRIIDERSKE